MAWPQASDYEEALQNPTTAFNDAELKAAKPVLTPLGLPRAITGNLAAVFELKGPAGRFAVRCFIREEATRARRYAALSAHLEAAKLQSLVGFQYIERGIRVKGAWYPILKMEWIDGLLLDQYVVKNLQNPAALRSLADQFRQVLADLGRNRIAHGDLQHRNILVAGGKLRLIDYDGMYVPGLESIGSPETGLPNYQHPLRTTKSFGPQMDNFSAWVIHLTLLALAQDPDLWNRLQGGDERLLVGREDYQDPQLSEAIEALRQLPTAGGASVGAILAGLVVSPLESIPRLDASPPVRIVKERSDVVASAGQGAGLWWNDPVHDPEPQQATWTKVSTGARLMLLLGVLAPLASWMLLRQATLDLQTATAAALAGIGLATAAVARSYAQSPPAQEREQAIQDLLDAQQVVADRLAALEGIRQQGVALAQEEAARPSQQRLADVGTREASETRRIHAELSRSLADLNQKRQQLSLQEVDDTRTALQQAIASYKAQELVKSLVRTAQIDGVDWALKQRLMTSGLTHAGQVTPQSVAKVKDLPASTVAAILEWRQRTEWRVESGAPHELSQVQKDAIRKRQLDRRAAIEQADAQARQRATQTLAALAGNTRGDRSRLEREAEFYRDEYARARIVLQKKARAASQALRQAEGDATRAANRLRTFEAVTPGGYLRALVRPPERDTGAP